MSIQKTDDNIQFDIGYDANNKPYVKPNKDREKALSDTGADIIVESVSNAYEKSMKEILKNQDKVVKAAHSIKLTSIFFVKDYLLYLHEERKKYGDDGIKDHGIALGQTMVGIALGAVSGAVGGAGGAVVGSTVPVVGTVAGAWTGTVTSVVGMSVAYDNKDIFGQPFKDHVGDFLAFATGKNEEFNYRKAIQNTAEGIKIRQKVEESSKTTKKTWAEKVSLPNLIKDNPNFVSNTEGLNEFNRIL